MPWRCRWCLRAMPICVDLRQRLCERQHGVTALDLLCRCVAARCCDDDSDECSFHKCFPFQMFTLCCAAKLGKRLWTSVCKIITLSPPAENFPLTLPAAAMRLGGRDALMACFCDCRLSRRGCTENLPPCGINHRQAA